MHVIFGPLKLAIKGRVKETLRNEGHSYPSSLVTTRSDCALLT